MRKPKNKVLVEEFDGGRRKITVNGKVVYDDDRDNFIIWDMMNVLGIDNEVEFIEENGKKQRIVMIIKGYKTRKSSTLGYRMGNPEKDFDLGGKPVESNYVVFVKLSDCKIVERDERKFYNADDAKSIRITYFGTYHGSSKLKKENNIYAESTWFRTVYFVRKGKVYTSRIKYDLDQVIRQQKLDKRCKEI